MGSARRLGNRQNFSPNDHAVGSLNRTYFHVASLLAVMRTPHSLIIALIRNRKQVRTTLTDGNVLNRWKSV